MTTKAHRSVREALDSYQMTPELKESLREWADRSGTDYRAAWANASDVYGLILLASDAILQLQRRGDPTLTKRWFDAFLAATGWTRRIPGGPPPDLERFRAAFDYVGLADELGLP